MLKEYQIKQLERISLSSEKTHALEIMQPAMTTMLDYQIARLERAVNAEINISRHAKDTIDAWKKTLELLKQARKLYA